MSIPGAASPLFLATTAGADAGFEISRSLRFNSADSAYLNRTPSSSSNQNTWTWSGWIKKHGVGTQSFIFGAAGYMQIYFSTDQILVDETPSGGSYWTMRSTAVLRDPSAWYHCVFVYDSSQATASNRFKVYVNNSEITSWVSDTRSNIVQNNGGRINSAAEHRICRPPSGSGASASAYANVSLAEVNFIDGSALDPTSFGAFDANGVWQAKDTSGLSFGTNGFRLKFADNSSNAALGTDSSGNSNTWSVNNLVADVVAANKGFDVVTYTGNGSTQSISSLAFQPSLVWIKSRSNTYNHYLVDQVRGFDGTNARVLQPNLNNAEESANGPGDSFASFDNDGFTVKLGTSGWAGTNQNNATYVAWCWKAGGAAVSNTDGTITSQVSANNTYGFSIVSFTASGSAGSDSCGHGLNTTPSMVIIKRRDSADNWFTWHSSFSNAQRNFIKLDSADAVTLSTNDSWGAGMTSSVIGFRSQGTAVGNMIAYVWSEVAGFSKFGTWQNNNSNTGTYVELGFRPRFILLKNSDNAENWYILDSARKPTNVSPPDTTKLQPNTNAAEGSLSAHTATIDFLDSGFQIKTTNPNSGEISYQTRNYIYAAFADKPDQSVIDSLVDTPTNGTASSGGDAGGVTVGNYATWNPLSNGGVDLSNGNLDVSNGAAHEAVRSTIKFPATGKYYAEFTQLTFGSSTIAAFGIDYSNATTPPNWSAADKIYLGINTSTIYIRRSGTALQTPSGTPAASGNVMQVAYDADNKKLWLGLGNTWYDSSAGTTGNPSSGANPTESNLEPGFLLCNVYDATGSLNAGQRAFSFAAPTGFKSLNTANLPTPTIADGSLYFDTKLYTGTGSAQSIGGLGFSPDLVWYKSRSNSLWHGIYDIVRGVNKGIFPNSTQAETTYAAVTAFNSDGFTIGTVGDVNTNSATYAAWAWDGGASTVTNNDGSVTSQVRASASSGFSIVSYTGTGANATFGHGLNAAPEFIIAKNRSASMNWFAYHKAIGAGGGFNFNTTEAAYTNDAGYWGGVEPTSNVFTGGTYHLNANDYIAYCFAPVEGYSSMGSFVGNGSTDGPFVYTGFKVAWLLTRSTSSSRSWNIWDTARDTHNPMDANLFPNNANAEGSDPLHNIDMLSNGFKPRTGNVDRNGSGETYIYLALASNPFASNGGLAR